jgi:hypothetical protein
MILLAAWPLAAELRYEVRHDRALKDHSGILTVDDRGIAYQQVDPKGKKKAAKLESVRWAYEDIQQLLVSPDSMALVTYRDRKWLLGIDKEYEFFLPKGKSFEETYTLLKGKLDQRFVAAIADPRTNVLWEIPVKLLGVIQGSEGVLQVGADQIVFKTERRNQSRTWRYEDIENVSTSGPFQLTLTTYERAKSHYGSLKNFNFQLKQRLDETRYDLVWKRLNKGKGLQFLSGYTPVPGQ